MSKLKLLIDTGYGHVRFYPACPLSKLFAKFRGRPSFTQEHLDIMKQLGFELEDATPPKKKMKL